MKQPEIIGFSLVFGLRAVPHRYVIPQHNIAVTNCYRILGGTNYTQAMNYQNDFYTSVSYSQFSNVDEAKSTWIFCEVENPISSSSTPKESLDNMNVCYIKNVQTGKYLDVAGAGIINGAPLVQYAKNSQEAFNQQFRLFRDGINYELEPYHTIGLKLDVPSANTNAGTQIQTYMHNSHAAQDFKFLPYSRNGSMVRFFIATKATNYTKVLQPDTSNDLIKQQNPSLSNTAQLWEVEFVRKDTLTINTNESFYFRNKASNHYFDVEGAKTSDGAQIVQYYFNGNNNQRFKFISHGDCSYSLIPQHATNKCLDIAAKTTAEGGANGASLQTFSYSSDKPNQKFKFRRASKDSFKILTGSTNYTKAISVDSDSLEAGKKIHQWDDLVHPFMEWIIEKAEGSNVLSLNHTAQVNINGMTERVYYFKPTYSETLYFETFGDVDTYMYLYRDVTGSGNYAQVTYNDDGGDFYNAKISHYCNANYRYKIVIRGYSAEGSGLTGLTVHK